MTIESNDAAPSDTPGGGALRRGTGGGASRRRVTGRSSPRGGTQPRADTVGSLLRGDAVVRAARRSSPADAALLNDAARDAIMLQEEIGLDVITDGEVRRVSWAQTPRFVDAFTTSAAADAGSRTRSGTDSGALNWRGGGEGVFGAPGSGGRPPGYPVVVRRDRDREAARGHDRRVLVPRPLRAGQDQVHHARAELPSPLLVTRPIGRRLRLVRGVPDRGPRLPAVGGGRAGRAWLRLHPARRAQLRLAVRPGHPRRHGRVRPRPGRGAGVRRGPRQLAVRRGDRGDDGAARLPGQRPGGRVALGRRLRRHLRRRCSRSWRSTGCCSSTTPTGRAGSRRCATSASPRRSCSAC